MHLHGQLPDYMRGWKRFTLTIGGLTIIFPGRPWYVQRFLVYVGDIERNIFPYVHTVHLGMMLPIS